MQAARESDVFDELATPIGGVQPEQIMLVWHKVEPILARVVNKPHTGFTLDFVLTELQLAHMQLWVIGDFLGVVVTAVQERPLHRVLWVQFIAGDNLNDWLDDWIKVQEEYARHNGCVAVEFSGRKGWNRLHEAHPDYKPILTTFRKEL